MTHRLLVSGELILFGAVGVRDLFDENDGFTAREVLEALTEHGGGDVTVRLNSGGGLAFEGIAIFHGPRRIARFHRDGAPFDQSRQVAA